MISDFIENRSFPVNWKFHTVKCEQSTRSSINKNEEMYKKCYTHTCTQTKRITDICNNGTMPNKYKNFITYPLKKITNKSEKINADPTSFFSLKICAQDPWCTTYRPDCMIAFTHLLRWLMIPRWHFQYNGSSQWNFQHKFLIWRITNTVWFDGKIPTLQV